MSIFNAIPWTAILKQAPALVKAADALLSGTLIRRPLSKTGDLEFLRSRMEALEAHDREDADLMKKMAEELQALTLSTKILAARVKLLFWISAIGLMTGAVALVLFFLVRA